MNAVEFLDERRAELEAFSHILFFKSSSVNDVEEVAPSASSSSPPRIGSYRRPASANIPVSRVVHEAKLNAKRQRNWGSDGGGGGTAYAQLNTSGSLGAFLPTPANKQKKKEIAGSNIYSEAERAKLVDLKIDRKHRRVLDHEAWIRLLKRKKMLVRRARPTAHRRRLARALALQRGQVQPMCECSRHPEGLTDLVSYKHKKNKKETSAQGSVTAWLPSHQWMVKRCRMTRRLVQHPLYTNAVHVRSQEAEINGTGKGAENEHENNKKVCGIAHGRYACSKEEVVTVAVATHPMRKSHRRLQRWVRNFASSSTATAATDHRSPPVAFLADMSHFCVYSVKPNGQGMAGSGLTTLEIAAMELGITAPSLTETGCLYLSSSGSSVDDQCSSSVIHGHMLTAVNRKRSAAPYVPVTLFPHPLSFSMKGTSSSDEDASRMMSNSTRFSEFILVAEVPVELAYCRGGRGTDSGFFSSVQLISSWSPCTAVPQVASLLEWWVAPVTSEQRKQQGGHATVNPPPQQALKLACRAWRAHQKVEKKSSPAPTKSPSSPKEACVAESVSSAFGVAVFPTFSSNPMTEHDVTTPVAQCVWRVLSVHSLQDTIFASKEGTSICSASMNTKTERDTEIKIEPSEEEEEPAVAVEAGRTTRTAHACVQGPVRSNQRVRRASFVYTRALINAIRRCSLSLPIPIGFKAGIACLSTTCRAVLQHLLGRPSYPRDYLVELPGASGRIGSHQAQEDRTPPMHVLLRAKPKTGGRLVIPHAHRGAVLLAVRTAPVLHVERMGFVTSRRPLHSMRLGCETVIACCCSIGGKMKSDGETESRWRRALVGPEAASDAQHSWVWALTSASQARKFSKWSIAAAAAAATASRATGGSAMVSSPAEGRAKQKRRVEFSGKPLAIQKARSALATALCDKSACTVVDIVRLQL